MIRKAPISMIMTEHVITLKRNDNLEKAEKLFKQYKIRHIPVVEDNTIVGMLSYSDLLRLSFADVTDDNDTAADVMVYSMFTIDQIMKKKIVCVSPSNSIKEVAEILAKKEFHALPVVNNNKLVGIVTTTDLINYLLEQF
ncbi:CBS domain-containing protein [Jejuia pallidilutea]|jgi:CBS domain-containing protein|uniref:CBS domain protein n=1 Tax=Jejuia pallidilutea TaxID=504487 RepID=A0A090W8D1_9FLAO|nr:CBS domain-containing protein [Jejuia pallidilutea]PQV51169.1 CBS domain protein [Jejuia pallidilutea]GAL68127.1 predicted signal-transduction protein containing cAMP-binding and CBS domains [Jejuia pallidilutea]GAL71724.1 predicted signal-transduction protein [Jejuia pallidilutea]GAL91119.1 predicted signal-transduction protein containing cAMP-binding and CBS domains [Jejuia pallidilutea]